MKFFGFLFILTMVMQANAQQRKAMTFQQRVQEQRTIRDAPKAIPETKFRISAAYEQVYTSPRDLNDFRNDQLWVGTAAAGETFSSLSGFTAGFGYKLGNSIYSLEIDQHNKKLSGAAVSSTTTVRDSIETETIQLVYDHIFQDDPDDSIELGFGVGMALKFRYTNLITNSFIGSPDQETGIRWEDTPFVFKIRAAYNYYFSANVGFRLSLGYQYLVSDQLKAAEDYNASYFGVPVTTGKNLTNINNQNVKVDLSGMLGSVGLTVNF